MQHPLYNPEYRVRVEIDETIINNSSQEQTSDAELYKSLFNSLEALLAELYPRMSADVQDILKSVGLTVDNCKFVNSKNKKDYEIILNDINSKLKFLKDRNLD